jgi:hypothetical protein
MTARHGQPVPARITQALDAASLWGDQVDKDLGVWESPTGEWEPGTAVDRWEDGTLVPTVEQIARLAELTRRPVEYFYLPPDEAELAGGRMFMCARNRRPENALTVVDSRIGRDGVLRREAVVEPRSEYRPRKKPAPAQRRERADDRHEPQPDPGNPGHCAECQMPLNNRVRHTTAVR